MKNCLQAFTTWIFCFLAFGVSFSTLSAQNVRDGFCDYSQKITCGVAVTNQTTDGGSNVIWDYPSCNSYTFSGPEKVYKLINPTAGTLQIDLSIHADYLDLDLLLLADDCSTPTCLAQSITSNANGKTEQIIYNNAAAGTYYIIVDSEKDVGAFDLLVSCNTGSNVCNLEYTATPHSISCGGNKGSIDIDISWGKGPFKIEWDNTSNSIWAEHTTSDKKYTITDLPAGTYTVKVTDLGATNCVEMKNGIVISNNGGNLNVNFSSTDAPCGSQFGWINVDVLNSSPPYWITVKGPASGTVQGNTNETVIKNIPPGNYEVTVEKGNCTKTGWVTVEKADDLDFTAEITDASCGGGKGSFWINVHGGSPTYTIEWWHKEGGSDWLQSSSRNIPLENMKAGEYTIRITDRNGCWKSKKMTIRGGNDLDFELEATAASCSKEGSIWVTIKNGTATYTVEWSGPSGSNWIQTNNKSFPIDNLKPGKYTITIEDKNKCKRTKEITVGNTGGDLDFELEANAATCNAKGAIWVTIKNGSPKYTVEWWGPNVSKWAQTASKSFQLKDLEEGEYTVKITDKNGCASTKKIKINGNNNGLDFTLETLGASCSNIGSIWIDIKNGQAKYSVDITGNNGVTKWFYADQKSIQVTELPPGYYTVDISDKNGCKGTKYITIQDKGGKLNFVMEANKATCGKNGAIWVTIKDGSPKFNIELWGPNNASFWAQTSSKSFQLRELDAGNYTLKITDKNGCSDTQTIYVGDSNSNLALDLEVENAGCSDDGKIWVTIKGGKAPYHLTWDGPTWGDVTTSSNGHQILNLKAGTYVLKVKDAKGCTYNKTVNVYGNSNNLKLELEANNATCDKDGYMWVTIKNGQAPYHISWTGPENGSINVNSSDFQLSNFPAGTYYITLKDNKGCTISKQKTIYKVGGDVSFSLESNSGSCGKNGNIWININSGNGPYHISWTGPRNGEGTSSTNGYQIHDLPAGWYKVKIKDKNGCASAKDIEVKGGSVLDVQLQQTAAKCDKGGEIWVDIYGGSYPYELTLNGPMVGHTTTNDNKYHFGNVPKGNYTLTVKDATGCEVKKQITVTGSEDELTLTIEKNNATCGTGGSAWIGVSGGKANYTLTWSGPVSGSAIIANDYQLNNLPTGNYTIKATDKNGCSTEKSITINDTGNSLTLSLEANPASCGQKGEIWISIGGGVATYTISWSGPVSGSTQSNNTSYQIANLPAGAYSVTVKDANGCTVKKSINIANNVQNFTIQAETEDVFCGQKGSIWVTMLGGSPNYTISWSGPVSGSTTTSQTNYNIENLPAGTYTVSVKEYSGCKDEKIVTIKDKGSNVKLSLEATNGVCTTKGNIWVTVTDGTPNYEISWTGPVAGSATVANSGYQIANLPSGTYVVTVKDANACVANSSIAVQNVGGNLSVSLSESSNVACEHDGVVDVDIYGGIAPYSIHYTGPTTATVQSTTNNTQVGSLLPGKYTFTITDKNGCSVTKKITIHDNGSDLSIKLTPTDATCGGKGKIRVDIEGGLPNYEITWYGGGVNSKITVSNSSFTITDLPIGNYTVKIKDGIGCSKEATTDVNGAGSNIGLQLIPKNDVCGQGGSIEVKITGGTADYDIEWTGPIAGSAQSNANIYQITGLTKAGNYSVTVKDATGCTAKEWVAINTVGDVNFTTDVTNGACNIKGAITVNITSGAPDYTISWTGPSTGSETISTNLFKIEDLSAGTYTITVKDNKGCVQTKTATVSGHTSNLSLVLTNTHTTCGEANGTITTTVTGGEGAYTYQWAGPVSGSETVNENTYTVWDVSAGNYTLTVFDKNGCSVSKTIQVSSAGNGLGLNVVGTNAACGQPSSIQVTISNGNPDFKIEWTGPTNGSITTGANSHTITDLQDGEYIVRATDNTGCTKAQAVIIKAAQNNINFTYESQDATCDKKGAIWLTIIDGKGPYQISWTGPSSGSSTSADEGVQITDLNAGTYEVTVKDNNACVIKQTIEVKNTGGGSAVNFAYKPRPVTCNKLGDILITMISGAAPYTVKWTGPSSGERTTSSTEIRIEEYNLTAGVYEVTVKGSGNCGTLTQSITVEDKDIILGINGTTTNGVCSGKGNVHLSWTGDRDPYTIAWSGAAVGSATINEQSYTLTDLKDGDYSFTVTGYDGCQGVYQTTINNSGTATIADFSYNINAKELTFSNLSTAGTYQWSFGDGNTSTEMNPVHAYAQNGTYTICLKVTNDCGSDEKCQSVTINALNNGDVSAKVLMGDKSGTTGTVLQLPVRVENCTRLATLSGTVKMGNKNVAKINGISPSTISPVYNDENHSFSYLAPGLGMNIDKDMILFYINIELVGGAGQTSSIDLSSLPVALELTCTDEGISSPITPEVGSGRVTIANRLTMSEVTGRIETYWGDGIVETMVAIESADHESYPMTSLNGEYEADDLPAGKEYSITPSKNTNPGNGLSTYGLFLAQKYILGYKPKEIQSPYQVIAMDANCSGSLTTFDIFIMQQMLVGNITEFPGCESWVFVDAAHEFPAEFDARNVFPYAKSHTMMLEDDKTAAVDFIGVKVGDILGRALPNDTYRNPAATNRNRSVIPLQITEKSATAGETFTVTLHPKDFESVVSFQLGLNYNAQAIEFVEFVTNESNELSSAITGNNRNQLKISWYHPTGNGLTLDDKEALISIKFKAKQAIESITDLFEINNRDFSSELHKQTDEAYQFALEAIAPAMEANFKVHQNRPNPFLESTTINVEMPMTLEAEILLHDHFGRIVRTYNQVLEKGMNAVQINRDNLSAGIYYYTVKAGDFADTKRIIVIER